MKVPMRTRAVLTLALSLVAFVNLGRSQVAGPVTEPAPAAAPAAETVEGVPPEAPVSVSTETTVVSDPAVTVSDPAEAPAATKAAEPAGDGRLSVDFPDEDIRNILRNVADLFELNLIIPETLQGKATIKLRNVTW